MEIARYFPIWLEFGGLVRNQISAANQILKPIQGPRKSEHIAGKHRLSSSSLSQQIQNPIRIALRT